MQKIVIIDGEETNYLVTDDGKVFNRKTGRELKGTIKRNDYRTVQLTIKGKPKSLMVHRLVAEAFCENPNGYTIVDHINRDKLDNRAENLRWVTLEENAQNSTPTKREQISDVYDITQEWKQCKVAPNYGITKTGIVFNLRNNKILKPSPRNGYMRVHLNGKNYSVHKLVYETYIGEIPKGMVIDHIDGNRANNNLSNLQLTTQSKNVKKTYDGGKRAGAVGVTSFTADGKEVKHYDTIKEAATEMGVTHAAVKSASNYGTRSHGFYWLRDDSISSKEEFVSTMPDDVTPLNSLRKTRISKDGLVYSATSRHLIPKFKDEKGVYCFVSTDTGSYKKFYLDPENSLNAG